MNLLQHLEDVQVERFGPLLLVRSRAAAALWGSGRHIVIIDALRIGCPQSAQQATDSIDSVVGLFHCFLPTRSAMKPLEESRTATIKREIDCHWSTESGTSNNRDTNASTRRRHCCPWTDFFFFLSFTKSLSATNKATANSFAEYSTFRLTQRTDYIPFQSNRYTVSKSNAPFEAARVCTHRHMDWWC